MQEHVWLIVYFFISSKFVLLQCQKATVEFRMPLWEVMYGYDEGKLFYIEIQLEIQGLSVARSASDYFHLVQMILPLFSEYLSLYCSASLISDFPGSWRRWSVLFVMLKGTWTAFQPKGLFEGNDTTNTLFAAEQASSHCCLKLRLKHLKSPTFLRLNEQPSPGFLHVLLGSVSEDCFLECFL